MYRAFFGLRERPFDLTPNPRFLVLTDAHREALSNLDYGISSRRGITLLVGEAGTGKTTLIRAALERQPKRVHCVHLNNPMLTRAEFVEMLAARFELSREARLSKATLLLELETLMRQRFEAGESSVLILDEAQSLPYELLEEIRLLANIETADTKLLSVVMAGQPELVPRLNDDSLRQLKQRIALRCELRPLTLTETMGYLAGRLAAAGGVGAQIFTREAVMLIHERSGGIPRTISVIADNALVSGFALEKRPVGRAIVEEVCRDLDLPPGVRAATVARPAGVPDAKPAAVAPVPPTRILSFDTPHARPAPPAGGPPPAAPATSGTPEDRTRQEPILIAEPVRAETSGGRPPADTADDRGGMFKAHYPKRRWFSFF